MKGVNGEVSCDDIEDVVADFCDPQQAEIGRDMGDAYRGGWRVRWNQVHIRRRKHVDYDV